jgi:autoinducer 2-degrading protein
MYVAHQHRTEHGRFFIYEQYVDDAALEAHRRSQHFQEYVVNALSGIARRVEGEIFSPLCDE